jgi:hypothetical protein
MKAITTFASAAALALGLASGAHAAVFAQFLPNAASADYSWVKTGATSGDFGALGSTAACTACAKITFQFLDGSVNGFLPAVLSFDPGTSATGAAGFDPSTLLWNQTNLNGGFHVTYYDPTKAVGSTQTIDGKTFVNGSSNILSGIFTNAWIQGAGGNPALGAQNPGGSGSTNLTIGNGGSLTFTSDYDTFTGLLPGSEAFAFNLLNALPRFNASTGQALDSFTANGGGNFSFTAGVPEPATWGLMIMGFGGMGLMLRNRRRAATATA